MWLNLLAINALGHSTNKGRTFFLPVFPFQNQQSPESTICIVPSYRKASLIFLSAQSPFKALSASEVPFYLSEGHFPVFKWFWTCPFEQLWVWELCHSPWAGPVATLHDQHAVKRAAVCIQDGAYAMRYWEGFLKPKLAHGKPKLLMCTLLEKKLSAHNCGVVNTVSFHSRFRN